MKILITGAEGFIGGHLIDALREDGHEVIGIDRWAFDLARLEECKLFFDAYKGFEAIIHMAARADPRDCLNNPGSTISSNITGTSNLLATCPSGVRFIMASSVVVYSNESFQSIKSFGRPSEITQEGPESLYGITKLACEHMVNMFTSNGRVRGINLRLCATVGDNLTHGLIYDFIRKITSDDEKLAAFGDAPGTCKPYMHIDDLTDLIKIVLKNDFCHTFNVAPNAPITVQQVAETMMEELGIQKEIDWQGQKSLWMGDNPYIECDAFKIRGLMPQWKPKYRTSQDVIREVIRRMK